MEVPGILDFPEFRMIPREVRDLIAHRSLDVAMKAGCEVGMASRTVRIRDLGEPDTPLMLTMACRATWFVCFTACVRRRGVTLEARFFAHRLDLRVLRLKSSRGAKCFPMTPGAIRVEHGMSGRKRTRLQELSPAGYEHDGQKARANEDQDPGNSPAPAPHRSELAEVIQLKPVGKGCDLRKRKTRHISTSSGRYQAEVRVRAAATSI
jgi:hypothetical protein